jgi:hypothetical protein
MQNDILKEMKITIRSIYKGTFVAFAALVVIGFVFMLHVPALPPSKPPTKPQNTPIPTTPAPISSANRSVVSLHTSSLGTHPAVQDASHQVKNTDLASNNPTFKTASGKQYPLRTYKTTSVNDPYGSQWWVGGTGLDSAWSTGAGPRQTTVAVIDTGFALNHEEFANRWATNAGEQGTTISENPSQLNCTAKGLTLNESCNLIDDDYDGIVDNESGATTIENPSHLNCTDKSLALDKSCNLIDDDGNGFVDDVRGWDFADGDANVQAGEVNPNGGGTQHATEVSGVLAATGNNGKGLAGVNWSTKILPLQAISDNDYGNTLTVSQAIYYAADRGVDLINLSLGTSSEDSYIRQAVQYALSKGSLVVAASGNDGCDCMLYPANYPEVFAVGAQNSSNQRSSFSSYGNNLDILAPGEDMITSTWTAANQTNAYVGGAAGTSFAAPYVSGLLSLARSHQPDATWGELTNALLASSSHVGLLNSTPFLPQIGSGYARANSYLSRVITPVAPGMRYLFGTSTTGGILGSNRVFDCYPGGNFPTAPLFAVTVSSSTFYTIDTLEELQAISQGATIVNLGRTCVGLPGDLPTTTRAISLSGEINNQAGAKY